MFVSFSLIRGHVLTSQNSLWTNLYLVYQKSGVKRQFLLARRIASGGMLTWSDNFWQDVFDFNKRKLDWLFSTWVGCHKYQICSIEAIVNIVKADQAIVLLCSFWTIMTHLPLVRPLAFLISLTNLKWVQFNICHRHFYHSIKKQ